MPSVLIRGLTAALLVCSVSAVTACGSQPAKPATSSAQTTSGRSGTRSTAARAPTVETRPATPAAATLLSSDDKAAFAALLRRTGAEGAIAFQSLDAADPQATRSLASAYAWSSIKPVIVARLLSDIGGPTGLSPAQQASARAALTASDNAAAMSLFEALSARHGGPQGAAAAMTDTLRKAGDSETTVSSVGRASFSPYGQTLWTPKAQTLFMTALARSCLLDRASTAYLLGLMNQVVAEQRWGFGTLSSVTALKGGWGPDPGGAYLVRQMGLLQAQNGEPVAFAAAVRPSDGSFASGTKALDAVAAWAGSLRLHGAAARACSGG